MRRLVLGGVRLLAAVQTVVGVWALVAPVSFFTVFPFGPPGWVGLLPPYNEHLARDVGGLSLALTVMLAGAAVRGDRFTVRLTVAAALVFAVPHGIYHQTHLEHFPAGIAVAQSLGIAVQVVVAVLAWVLAARLPRTALVQTAPDQKAPDQTALRSSVTGSTTDPARRSS